ncbi:MAG: hypothetical protein M1814_001957 [Vezdaea aestivalis]|nr:MAG: hypothetical protein M1814_001957 [Vezdaea aestivalis]
MRLATIFGAVSSALMLGSASATCFKSGETWGGSAGKDSAFTHARKLCDNSLKGNYAHGETRVKCVKGYQGTTYKYTIHLKSNNARDLGLDECLSGLGKEISGCDRGGKTAYTNWEYTSDPGSSDEGCP